MTIVDPCLENDEAPPKKRKEDVVKRLVALVEQSATVWRSQSNEPHITITIRGHDEHYPVGSSKFEHWLAGTAYDTLGLVVKKYQHEQVKTVLSHKARQGKQYDVYLRVAHVGDRIYWDMGNEAWEVIEHTSSGWGIVTNPPVKFRRADNTGAIPYPTKGGCRRCLFSHGLPGERRHVSAGREGGALGW